MKTNERITKTSQDGSLPLPRRPRRLLRVAFTLTGLVVVLGAAYSSYRHRPTSEAEIAHIESLIARGDSAAARVLMVDAQARARNIDALRLRVGRAYLRQGAIGPATALLSKVEGALIAEERVVVAEYLLVQGDPFSAVSFYEAAMRTGMPKTAGLLGRYGEALSLSGNKEGAVAALRQALGMDASKLSTRLNLAVNLANLNRTEEARVEALTVLEVEPANQKALSLLAVLGGSR